MTGKKSDEPHEDELAPEEETESELEWPSLKVDVDVDEDVYEDDSDDEDELPPAVGLSDDDDDQDNYGASDEDWSDVALGAESAFDDAADVLDQWAQSAAVRDDAMVGDLLRGLRQREDLTFWATLDLDEELPDPRPRVVGALRSIARLLVFVRNVAVFAPVALTWQAISRVSPAFGEYAEERALQGLDANFLQYWTFSAPAEYQIQKVALDVVLIVLGIIAATLIAGVINELTARPIRKSLRRREDVIRQIRRALHGARQATPESLATSLAESMTELLESSRLIIDAARRLEQASIGVSQLEPTFVSLNSQLKSFDDRLGDTIIGSVDRLNAAVAGLSGMMEGSLRGLLAESVAGLDEVRDQLHRTAASVEFGTQQLIKDLGGVARVAPRR
jgi:hypothetical protein